MNHVFAEATTSVAFGLMLTKRQCNTLLRVAAVQEAGAALGVEPFPLGGMPQREGEKDIAFWQEFVASSPMPSLHALQDRGLVFWHYTHEGKACGFGGLTKAGELVVGLLKEAGLTIENTNTLSVLKRLQRAA